MTESAGLERGYRRLLGAYPLSFRREQEEEMLAVLMAGASPGQRWPGLAEAADVIRSGLGMRLRRAGLPPGSLGWADALMVFSLAVPLLVVAVGLLDVALPYPLPRVSEVGFRDPYAPREFGGLSLLHVPSFDIAVGGQVLIAVVVLLGLRRLALAVVAAAAAGFWIAAANNAGIPEPMWVLGAAALPLEALALIVVPSGRRDRWLLRWREGVGLLLAAGAVQVLTLMSDARSPFAWPTIVLQSTATSAHFKILPQPGIEGYVAAILVLAAAVAGLAVTLKISRFVLLLVVLCYPVVAQLVASVRYEHTDLMDFFRAGNLAVLWLPPLLLLAGIMIHAYTRLRERVVRQPGSA